MNKETQTIRGFKVTNPDGTAKHGKKNIVYRVGETYTHKGAVELCASGFHFCQKAADCFKHYAFDSKNKVFEVEGSGDVKHGENKSACATLTVIREIPWAELLQIANEGKDNTGLRNTGNRNTGYSNTGYRNTGDWNTGAFCAGEAPFFLFNQPTDWSEQDFLKSRACQLMRSYVDTKMWVPDSKMTDVEKAANPGWKNAEGFYRDIPFKDAFRAAWQNWTKESREAFTSLPNFSPEIFLQITGWT